MQYETFITDPRGGAAHPRCRRPAARHLAGDRPQLRRVQRRRRCCHRRLPICQHRHRAAGHHRRTRQLRMHHAALLPRAPCSRRHRRRPRHLRQPRTGRTIQQKSIHRHQHHPRPHHPHRPRHRHRQRSLRSPALPRRHGPYAPLTPRRTARHRCQRPHQKCLSESLQPLRHRLAAPRRRRRTRVGRHRHGAPRCRPRRTDCALLPRAPRPHTPLRRSHGHRHRHPRPRRPPRRPLSPAHRRHHQRRLLAPHRERLRQSSRRPTLNRAP